MYSLLSKYGQLVALGVGVLITLLFFGIIMSSGDKLDAASQLSLKEGNAMLSATSIFDLGLYAVLFLTIAAAIAAVVFGIVNIAKDPKGSMKSLIGIGVLLAIFLIGYMAAGTDGDDVMAAINKFNGLIKVGEGENVADKFEYLNAGKSSFIGGALNTAYVLGGVAFLGLIVSEVMNLFR